MARLVLLLLCTLLVGGCNSFIADPPTSWVEYKFKKPLPREDAWFLITLAADRLGLPQDTRLSDKAEGLYLSIWIPQLRMQAKYQRARLEVEWALGEGGRVESLRFQVERQLNNSMSFEADPAEWKPAGQNRTLEDRFGQHLVWRDNPKSLDYKATEKPDLKTIFPGDR